jgi:hypothetical protein
MGEQLTWSISDVTVTRVVESVVRVRPDLLPTTDDEVLRAHASWLRPHFVDDDGNLLLSIHALAIAVGDRRIVVDTCVGSDRRLPGHVELTPARPLLADLAAAGFPREEVDSTDRHTATFDDAVRPVVDAGLADFVGSDHRVCDELWLEPTPGHTPGHVAVRVESGGRRVLITGDCTHHPVQFAEPGWCAGPDTDPAQSEATRRRLFDQLVDDDVLVIGTHFAPPCSGRVVRDGNGWRFVAVAPADV